jgi:hypothetical protein
MGVSLFFGGFGRRKTKPIKANLFVLSAAFCVLRKVFEKTKPIYSYCVLRDAYCEKYLKKQSQFLEGQNERKVKYRKELWSLIAIGHLVKTNPIQSMP